MDKEYGSKASTASTAPLLCRRCAIGPLTVYGPTARENPDWVMSRRRSIRVYEAHELIFQMGQMAQTVLVIYSGWAAKYVPLSKGQRQIIDFRLPSDLINPSAVIGGPNPMPAAVRALTPLIACEFPLEVAGELFISDEAQRREMTNFHHTYLSALYQKLADTARLSAEARIAKLALNLRDRLLRLGATSGHGFDFPVRREDFADAIGVTLVHLNRTLAALHKVGALSFEHRRLEIKDEQMLKALIEG